MPEGLLGFGGNLGDVAGAIDGACSALPELGVSLLRRSSFYRTEPWGPVAQPDFLNACALISTDLSPHALLAVTQRLERQGGRQGGERWGPRPLDIDILAYGDLALSTPDLTIPHPRATERAFVLVPLAEIAPDWPLGGRRVKDWLDLIDRGGVACVSP